MMKLKTMCNKIVSEGKGFGRKRIAGDSHFIAIAVSMIIVVVIAALFRTQLLSIFTNMFGKLDTTVNGLF